MIEKPNAKAIKKNEKKCDRLEQTETTKLQTHLVGADI